VITMLIMTRCTVSGKQHPMKKIRVFFCETVAELISSHEKTVLAGTSTRENGTMMLIS
jgi:hypothetical protein